MTDLAPVARLDPVVLDQYGMDQYGLNCSGPIASSSGLLTYSLVPTNSTDLCG